MNYTSWWVLQSQTTTPLIFSINTHSSPRRLWFLKAWKVKASNAPCFSFPAILKLETEFGNISGMEHGTWTWILGFEWFRLPPPPKVMFQSNIAMHLLKFLILKQKCYPHSIFHRGQSVSPCEPVLHHKNMCFWNIHTMSCSSAKHARQRASALRPSPSSQARKNQRPQLPREEEVLLREWHWWRARRYSLPHWSRMTSWGKVL